MSEINQKAQIEYLQGLARDLQARAERAEARITGAAQPALDRRQIAEAIADGFTSGNETFDQMNDAMRMRICWAAMAVEYLLSSDGGVESGHANASGSGPLPEPTPNGDACSALEPPHQAAETVGRYQELKRAAGVTTGPSDHFHLSAGNKSPEWFCQWLKGYLGAIPGRDELDAFEANSIRNTLNEVLGDQEVTVEPQSFPKWRHLKRGSIVTEVARGFAQVAHHPIEEMTAVVIYKHDADGVYWVRNAVEFDDGRFEPYPLTRPVSR